MSAKFYEQEARSELKEKRKLSRFLDALVAKHDPDREKVTLRYIFCTDSYLLQINKQYLDHDTYTDIITFDLSEPGNGLDGEIYISVDRVKENSGKFGVTYEDELHRVIFHGALHLCGFKDKKEKDRKIMSAMENESLRLYKAYE